MTNQIKSGGEHDPDCFHSGGDDGAWPCICSRTPAKAGEDGALSMRINELLQNDPVCRGRVTVETIDRIAALSSIEEPRDE